MDDFSTLCDLSAGDRCLLVCGVSVTNACFPVVMGLFGTTPFLTSQRVLMPQHLIPFSLWHVSSYNLHYTTPSFHKHLGERIP